MSDVGNVKIVLGGTALRHTVIANQNKCWPHRQRQAKFPAFLPAFAPVLPPKPAARPQAAQPRLLPWSPPARPRQRLRASSNAVDANREQVESVGWARNHRALKSSLGAFSAPIYYAKVAKRFRARLNPSNARNANPMPISTHVEGSGAPKTTSDGSESVNRTSAYHAV